MLMNTQILITYCFAAFKFAVSSPCQRIRDLGVGLQSALIVSRRTCGNLFLVHRGNCGPLDTASGPSVHSIGRNRSVGRSRSLWRSICAPGWTAPGSLSLPTLPPVSVSLPSLFPSTPAAIVRQSNNWYCRSRSPSFSTPRKEGAGARQREHRGLSAGFCTERASQVFTASAADQCSPLSLSPFLSPMKEVSAAKTVETAG